MPNGVADPLDTSFDTDPTLAILMCCGSLLPWRAGGERPTRYRAELIAPGVTSPPAINGYVNVLRDSYANPVRAGYSNDVTDTLTGTQRDAADDNLNAFDPTPRDTPASSTTKTTTMRPGRSFCLWTGCGGT